MAQDPNTQLTPEGIETPAVTPVEQQEPQPFYAQYGFADEDSFKSYVGKRETYASLEQEIETLRQRPQINPELAAVNDFIGASGNIPLKEAVDKYYSVMGYDPAKLDENPSQAESAIVDYMVSTGIPADVARAKLASLKVEEGVDTEPEKADKLFQYAQFKNSARSYIAQEQARIREAVERHKSTPPAADAPVQVTPVDPAIYAPVEKDFRIPWAFDGEGKPSAFFQVPENDPSLETIRTLAAQSGITPEQAPAFYANAYAFINWEKMAQAIRADERNRLLEQRLDTSGRRINTPPIAGNGDRRLTPDQANQELFKQFAG